MAELALAPRRAAAHVALRAAPRLGRTPAPTGSGKLVEVLALHAVDGEEGVVAAGAVVAAGGRSTAPHRPVGGSSLLREVTCNKNNTKLLLCSFDKHCKENPIYMYVLLSVLGIRIRIRRIGMFLGLPNPDPDLLVRGSGSFPFLICVEGTAIMPAK
jgi:hypothetical protein